MDKKGPFTVKELKALSPGKQIWGKYLILEKVTRKTKEGKDLTNLKIGDSTGDMDVIVWDSCQISGDLQPGSVIGLLGDLGLYRERLQLTGKRIKIMDEPAEPFMRTPEISIDCLIKDFDDVIASIDDIYMQQLLQQLFHNDLRETFIKAPAAKKIHHNYLGGLLEHSLNVARLCRQVSAVYPVLNKDLLITGALLHDLGKIEEYKMKIVPEYTVSGRMLGHIVLGCEMVSEQINKIRTQTGYFPEELELMLKHMVLSHHGSLEFASPVIPLFPEALVLHMMDNMDAKLFVFLNRIDEENGEGEPYFTSYDTLFAQQFFKYRYKSKTSE
ncbi:MAG: HD domain-containing protein [Syntrophomonadaceae bacterium]|jgi:3'-5' exoribonuclease|nr:HD domain-containing protein [Syntrophomonadaceae bacterium]